MTWDEALQDPDVRKRPLMVVRPRIRLTGWTEHSANVYVASMPWGYVTRCWTTYANDEGREQVFSIGAVHSSAFYYDHENQLLYVGELFGNPDDYTVDVFPNVIAGITVEFELHFSDQQWIGPRDPLSASSQAVTWHGGLRELPMVQQGSSDSLYGAFPLSMSNLQVADGDGELLKFLYNCSFSMAPVRGYICAHENAEKGITRALVRQVFSGFAGGISWQNDQLSIQAVDFLQFLDREYSNLTKRFNTTDFPNVDPAAYSGRPASLGWFVRRVFGMVDGFVPVNVDYNATPATNNNRIWITQLADGTAGTVAPVMDHLAANTNTRTYFVDTPPLTAGDWIRLNHASGVKYTEVESVNYASKYIEHEPLTRTVASGETVDRYHVARVIVEDSNGQNYWLRPGVDYTPYSDGPNGVIGFEMADNWEASLSFADTIFDPSTHRLSVRVYGRKDLPEYASTNDVGAVTNHGGVRAAAVSILFQLLRDAGIAASEIDETTFDQVTSHSIGFAVPAARNQYSELPTYKALIEQILNSMLWKLSLVESSSALKIGLYAVQPFVASAEYDVNESQHWDLKVEHGYRDIYSRVALSYFNRSESGSDFEDLEPVSVAAESSIAKHLHFVDREWAGEVLQYDATEAQEIADRIAYAVGDRRGLYTLQCGQEFISALGLGVSIDLIRQRLPGYDYEERTLRTRQLAVIEVQKSTLGVTLTAEDQKGIQDNAGSW